MAVGIAVIGVTSVIVIMVVDDVSGALVVVILGAGIFTTGGRVNDC